MPINFLIEKKMGFSKLISFGICILMISIVFHSTSSVEETKKSGVLRPELPEISESKTRYGNRIVEDFNNLTYIDSSNTTASIRTMDGRVMLWGSSPIIPPTYKGRMNQNTRSHGGGFSPKYNEYWYPQWAGSTIYRYDINNNYLGSFNSGTGNIMQLWGDKDGTYYTANWGNDRVYKWSDRGNNQIWSYHMGSTTGGVCCDDNYVYAMVYNQNQVRVLRKDNGQHVRNFNINGNPRVYGGLAFANGLLYVGGYNNNIQNVGIINPANGALVGQFNVQESIYNMAFNGEEYCISANNNNPHRYKISDGNAYLGNDIEPPTNITYIQSKILYDEAKTIGAVKATWFEHLPQGTEIIYKLSVDGKNWITVENETSYILEHRGSALRWNATIKTDDKNISPYIDKIIIEYDLFSNPQPHLPQSHIWQGTQTPKLEWNFTDPDKGDYQSEYLVEIYNDEQLSNQIYNSSWVNSSFTEHTISDSLVDGVYFWRARTKDNYNVASNYSYKKSFKIDVTRPVGNITIHEGISSVNDKLVDLAIHAFDNASGVADMQIIGDRGNEGPWEEFATEKRFALTPLDGLKKIIIRFRDNAGIVSEDYNDTIYFDLKGPFDIEVTSPTHPDPMVYYNSTLPVFSWEPPYEVTGIKGYTYTVDSTPVTEPPKVLYNQNNDLTGTYPGEFAGLSEGTWYFHITPCDIYDQWGNTTHFRFNIDSIAPVISGFVPTDGEWFRRTDILVEATFADAEGFGLDTNTIEYSYRKSGEGTFSGWTSDEMEFEILEEGIDDNPVKVRAWVQLGLAEGDRNAVLWRVNDISGNGPVESDRLTIKVDLTPVTFSDPLPANDIVSIDTMVSVGLTISDAGGSGVDGKTVEYSISAFGNDSKYFVNWTNANNNMVNEILVVLMDIGFEPGRDNYIMWRAKDAVGNGYAVSEVVRIWVNSAPSPVIALPYDDQKFEDGATVTLSAIGTEDNEGDELSYYWELKGKTSKKIVFKAWGPDANTTLDKTGKYLVYLYVNDGLGFNESIKLTIEVIPQPTGNEVTKRWEDKTDSDGDGLPDWWEELKGLNLGNPNDATDPQKDLYRSELAKHQGATAVEDDFLSSYWWILLIVGVLVVLMIIGIIVITVKKGKNEEEVDNVEYTPQQRYSPDPYPMGSRDFHYPQYSEMYASLQSQPGYSPSYGTGGGWGGGTGGAPVNNYPQVQLPPTAGTVPDPHRPALPMSTESPMELQPLMDLTLPPLDLSLIAPEMGAQQEETSENSPEYSLPVSTSGLGTPNLDLKALPPATGVEAAPIDQVDAESGLVNEAGMDNTQDQPAVDGPISPAPETEESVPGPLEDIFSSLPTEGTTESEMPAESPVEEKTELPGVQCHACGSMNQVETTERPTTITCTNCSAQGYLAE